MFRISILETGEFFVMGESSLPMDFQSSFFNRQGDFLGDKSFSGKLPLLPNRRLIRNSHYINTDNALRTVQVMMWLKDMPFKEAVMTFRIENVDIVYELKLNSSIIAPQLKTKKLHELADPNIDDQLNFPNAVEFRNYMMSTTVAIPGTVPMYFFPYKNELAYKDIPVADQGAYPDIAFPVNPYINAWKINLSTLLGQFVVDVGPADSETHTPFFTVAYVVKRILKYFGYTPQGEWLESEIANRVCIFSNISVLKYSIADYVYFMPDIVVSDFLKELRTQFGLLIAFNQTDMLCTVSSLKNMRVKGKVVDLRTKQLAKSYRETGTSPSAYTITQAFEDSDKAFENISKDTMPVLNIGVAADNSTVEPITLNGVATMMIKETSPAHATFRNWRIPNIKMPVCPTTPLDQISDFKESDRHNFKLRFLYYHGMVQDSAADLYPYGSSDNLDFSDNQLTPFTLALNFNGAAYSGMQEYYTYLKNSRPFQQGFKLNHQDLRDLTPDSRILVKDLNEATVECMYDVASADLGKGPVIMALITLYPDIQPNNTQQILPIEGVPVDPPIPPPDNGLVYVKLVTQNFKNVDHPYPPPRYQTINMDVVARFYSDAAGTIPKDVVSLNIRLKIAFSNPAGTPATFSYLNVNCTSAGSESMLLANAQQFTNQGGTPLVWEYFIDASTLYTVI
jgi:hypothetical protein